MGKRTRSQRKGSSPKYRVSSHRFPGANRLPSVKDEVVEVVEEAVAEIAAEAKLPPVIS